MSRAENFEITLEDLTISWAEMARILARGGQTGPKILEIMDSIKWFKRTERRQISAVLLQLSTKS